MLKGEYKKRSLRLEDIAAVARIPYGTLRKKIAGQSPIFAGELIRVAAAIGVPAGKVMDEAVEMYGGLERLMSEAAAITESSDDETEYTRGDLGLAAQTRHPESDTDEDFG